MQNECESGLNNDFSGYSMCLEQLCRISAMHVQEILFRSFSCLAIPAHISVCGDGVSQDEGLLR